MIRIGFCNYLAMTCDSWLLEPINHYAHSIAWKDSSVVRVCAQRAGGCEFDPYSGQLGPTFYMEYGIKKT